MNTLTTAHPLARLGAKIVDDLILSLPVLMVFAWIVQAEILANFLFRLVTSVAFFMSWMWIDLAYRFGLRWKRGQTIGMQLFGLELVSTENEAPTLSWNLVLFREIIGKVVSSVAFGSGFWHAFFVADKRMWHDRLAGTTVIQKQPRQAVLLLVAILVALAVQIGGYIWIAQSALHSPVVAEVQKIWLPIWNDLQTEWKSVDGNWEKLFEDES